MLYIKSYIEKINITKNCLNQVHTFVKDIYLTLRISSSNIISGKSSVISSEENQMFNWQSS